MASAQQQIEDAQNQTSSYENLIKAYAAFQSGNYTSAANVLQNVQADLLSVDAKEIYDSIYKSIQSTMKNNLKSQGEQAFYAKDYETAITDLNQALEMDDSDYEVLNLLAHSYRLDEQYDKAVEIFQKIVDQFPGKMCIRDRDWGAHLPDAGIFRPVYLLTMTEGRIDSVYIRQEHEEGKVTLHFDVSRNPKEDLRKEIPVGKEADGYTYEVTVKAPEGTEIIAKDSPEALVIEQPKRWWPNGVGEQPLYEVTVTLAKDGQPVDSWTRKIGLRTMTMDIHPDEWGESFAHQVKMCIRDSL